LKNIFIISDIIDPCLGSEFRIALKALEILYEEKLKFIDEVKLLIPRRNKNIENLNIWFSERNIENIIIEEFKFEYADTNGNHNSKFLFIRDLINFYRKARKAIPIEPSKKNIIFKCGQVNWVFYLIFLFFFKKSKSEKIVCAPISGFIYIKLRDCIELPFKTRIYYILYNAFIFVGRFLFRFLYIFKNNYYFLFATYSDCHIFHKEFKDKIYSEIQLYNTGDFLEKESRNYVTKNKSSSILWSGHLVHRKNPLLALRIISDILKFSKIEKIYFIGNGPLNSDVFDYMEKTNLKTNKRFIYISNLSRYEFLKVVKKVDYVLITSLREVNSIFFLESLFFNKKIFAIKNSGIMDFDLANVVLLDSSKFRNAKEISEVIIQAIEPEELVDFTSKEYLQSRYYLEKHNLINLLKSL
tara:strand:+ start:5461 stop:6699 length:1239 start_codon:yes stop_codon:yes gene_type:complete